MAKLKKLPQNSKGIDQLDSVDSDSIDVALRRVNGKAPNVRKVEQDSEGIKELQESLKRYGQLQPVGISKDPGPDGTHELLYGFRRFAAISQLGWDTIKAVKLEVDPENREAVQLVENIHREDMTDGEIAQAVAKMKERAQKTAAEIAVSLGKTESWVKKRLHHASMLQVAQNLPELDKSSTSNFLGVSTQVWDAVRKVDGAQQQKAVRFILERWSEANPPKVKEVREYIDGLKKTSPPKSKDRPEKNPDPQEGYTYAEWIREHKAVIRNAEKKLTSKEKRWAKEEIVRLAKDWFPDG